MSIDFEIGLNSIASYRRLAYTPWHAIAEFIDNSTQSYMNNREDLDAQLSADGSTLDVGIIYDRDGNRFSMRITPWEWIWLICKELYGSVYRPQIRTVVHGMDWV